MNIQTMTIRQVLDAMGSKATDAEGLAMIKILQKSDFQDTAEISSEDWRAMMDSAIADAAHSEP